MWVLDFPRWTNKNQNFLYMIQNLMNIILYLLSIFTPVIRNFIDFTLKFKTKNLAKNLFKNLKNLKYSNLKSNLLKN